MWFCAQQSGSNGQRSGSAQPPRGAVPSAGAHWAALEAEAALAELGSSRAGLDPEEVAGRLSIHGRNLLPEPVRRHWMAEIGANFFHFFALLLWVAAGLALVIHSAELCAVIVAVIVINGAFSFWQEYQAERAIEALKALLPQQVTVRRSGGTELIDESEVVPGDLLILIEGEAVPADARVIKAERLRIDNSALTGESRPVPRFAASAQVAEYGTVALPNLVFAGTTTVSGYGEAVVFATGAATEFGRIARLTRQARERPTPLQREVIHITHVIAVLSVAMGVLFFTLGTMMGGLTTSDALMFAIGIIVANVPEGLLPTMTLALALAVKRMARRNALVKRLASVETLGATSVILTDKTGTLTQNEMTVRELWTPAGSFQFTGSGYDPSGRASTNDTRHPRSIASAVELIRTAALCCDARLIAPRRGAKKWSVIGDPTEAAIVVAAAKLGLGADALAAAPRVTELAFDSIRKRMTTIQLIGGAPAACVKGAISHLLPLCTRICAADGAAPLDTLTTRLVMDAHRAMATRGLRVLAVATRSLRPEVPPRAQWEPAEIERDLTLLGLIAMEDPPRPEVPGAIAACHRAGVRIVMITGDDPITAEAIAREIELCRGEPLTMTGPQLDTLSDDELVRFMERGAIVFARVAPEHKLRLVQAFQRTGAVVAVTGDGVNDAPALKAADIGIAMGATGSDVARAAADMVLLDDSFGSIAAAIEQGRAVYENIRKFLTYVLVHNVPEAAAFIAFILLGIPLPLTAIQVLAIDLGTEVLPALALGGEAAEPDTMRRAPRNRRERLLDRETMALVYGWLGPLESLFALTGYLLAFRMAGIVGSMALPSHGPIYRAATTMTFAGIVACQAGNALASRTRRRSVFALGIASNRALLYGIAASLAILALLLEVGALARMLGFEPPRARQWLVLAAYGPAILLIEETRKAISRARRSDA